MANGAVARLPFDPPSAKPKSSPATITAGKPSEPIETAIGSAVAAAVTVFYRAAIDQQQTGTLAPTTIAAGGSRIATIALLQLDHELGDDDFFRRAHEQGKYELHRYLGDADLFQRYAPGEVDAVLDMAIDSIFEIVTRVVRDERAFRAAWAN